MLLLSLLGHASRDTSKCLKAHIPKSNDLLRLLNRSMMVALKNLSKHADSVYHTCRVTSVNFDGVDWGHDNYSERSKTPITATTQLSGAAHKP
jgi:hypothetical protein